MITFAEQVARAYFYSEEGDEEWDDAPLQIRERLIEQADNWIAAVQVYTNPEWPPPRAGLEDHQLWVWMNGANPPRWEIRGTGALL